jgi:hydrogenase maturation protease
MSFTLVIGYGSSLHRDDAVGLRVAEDVAEWHRPEVRALAVPQLTPELVESIRRAGRVVFVDATVEGAEYKVRVQQLHADGGAAFGHFGDACWLLGLCLSLHGRCPEAWLITIPAADVGLGEGLTPQAETGVEEALALVNELTR